MIKKYIGAGLVTLALLLSLGSGALPAHAASLTSTQVQAVISLLQSFGVDSNVIANVSATLGGSTPEQSNCITLFSDTTLGSSGAEVIKLQNYLIRSGLLSSQYNTGYYGIITAQAVGKLQMNLGLVSSTDDTSFGLMGPQTRTAIACGNNSQPVQNTSATFRASPSSGAAPTSVTFAATGGISYFPFAIDFGDGSQGFVDGSHDCAGSAADCSSPILDYNVSIAHTYVNPGTYTATLSANVACYTISTCPPKRVVGSKTIVITGSNVAQPSATIDQSSLSQSVIQYGSPTITGTAANTSQLQVYINGAGGLFVPVVNGRWSATLPNSRFNYSSGSTWSIQLRDNNTGSILTTGTLVITGNLSTQPSATIDDSSLTTGSATPTITGTAANTNYVTVQIYQLAGAKVFGSGSIPVINGRWTSPWYGSGAPLSNDTYTVYVYDANNNLLTSRKLTVTGSTPTQPAATINITSPQTGNFLSNSLEKGDGTPATNPIATIAWSSSNVGNYPIEIDLLNTSNAIVKTIATGLSNSGTYRWLYDSTIPSGTYTLLVSTQSKEGAVGGAAGRSGIFFITTSLNGLPVINSVSPTSGTAGTFFAISGTKLSNASAVQVYYPNGQLATSLVPSSVTSSSLSFMLLSSFLGVAGAGTYQIKVVTPAGTSNALSINVSQPSATTISIAGVQQPSNTLAPQGAIVPFTKFSITNTSTSDVTVSSMQFKQTGSGSSAALKAIELTDDAGGDVMVPNYSDGTLFNSSNITGAVAPMVIHGGQTKTFTVSGWMQSNLSAYAGGLLSLSLINLGSTAGVTINGYLGITGATDTINSTLNACYPPQTSLYGYKCW